MDAGAWIAVASTIVQVIASFFLTLWQVKSNRSLASLTLDKPEHDVRRKSLLPRVWMLIVAVLFWLVVLVREVLKSEQLTRSSVLVIALSVGFALFDLLFIFVVVVQSMQSSINRGFLAAMVGRGSATKEPESRDKPA